MTIEHTSSEASFLDRHISGDFDRYDRQEEFGRQIMEKDKQEALWLAVRARWVALALIAVLTVYVNPRQEVLYYLAILGGFALIGWAQLRVGRAGASRPELFLLFCDLALMTWTQVIPNPFRDFEWSHAMNLRFEGFEYFYVLLAAAMLSYSWRTLLTMGVWVGMLWSAGITYAWFQLPGFPELSAQIRELTEGHPELGFWLDPDQIIFGNHIQHVVVFMIIAGILALAKRRSQMLLLEFAMADRERTNLSRYFSPNVVEELARNDEPLKQIRNQNVAVLFVDIVGFTRFADSRPPEQVIRTLREFLQLMEREVFRHSGTIDKYLGDGLMATFGTPVSGDMDATNSLRCGISMINAVEEWNNRPNRAGDDPVRIRVGAHYGPAVLGDIGASRLEFAVLGSTVNIASRLEALTRQHETPFIVSDTLIERVSQEQAQSPERELFSKMPPQEIRGITAPVDAWMLATPAKAQDVVGGNGGRDWD